MNIFSSMFTRESPMKYEDQDGHLQKVLGTKEMIALGIGAVVGAGIFTMPGIVAADYAGPAVVLSFIIAAIIAGLSALAYSEMASAMPFAGSIYTWGNVIYGEFIGWVAGWAILAEYVVAIALISSSWSAYFRGFINPILKSLKMDQFPQFMSGSFNPQTGTSFDFFAMIALLLVGVVVARGVSGAAKVENLLVIGKVAVIVLFIVVGATAIRVSNWVPFIPKHIKGTEFGGISGVFHGASQVFFAYLGFDMIAANSAEVKDAQKTMPKAILGTLGIATALFVGVSAVLTGMFKYSDYKNNAEPAAWALREAGHLFTANLLSAVALVGLFSGMIAVAIGGSRLIYSFGRDGMLPRFFGKLDKKGQPVIATVVVTIVGIVLSSFFTVGDLGNLVSAGTLIAFIVASVGILILRQRKDIDHSGYKMPLYPVLPIVSALASAFLFWSLSSDAKMMMLYWILAGVVVYFIFVVKRLFDNKK
ncbi:MAG: amino acid permease [Lactobacillaceae bacterium]|jgi:APA family basic amino acid/polyamine antiporter|nr:amino acid permease [Lactobacillaceae bacterium]